MSDRPPRAASFDNGQDIRERTSVFACRVVRYCEAMHAQGGTSRSMAWQLVACATSVAAMLEEARAAESTRDFISKCSIALKEARESWVSRRICDETARDPSRRAASLASEASEIVAILTAIVQNTRRNAGLRGGSSRR